MPFSLSFNWPVTGSAITVRGHCSIHSPVDLTRKFLQLEQSCLNGPVQPAAH
jgi:hypothetical protein